MKTKSFIYNSDNYLITSKLALMTQNLSSILQTIVNDQVLQNMSTVMTQAQVIKYYILSNICTLLTLFQCGLYFISITLRTKPCISHQFHKVLNNNSYSIQQSRVCTVIEYYQAYTSIFKNISYHVLFLSLIINLNLCYTCFKIFLSSHYCYNSKTLELINE